MVIQLSTWGVVGQGSCIQIMAVPPAVYKGAAAATPGRPFPPMLFVHMARDGATAAVAAQDVAALTAEVRQLYTYLLQAVVISNWLQNCLLVEKVTGKQIAYKFGPFAKNVSKKIQRNVVTITDDTHLHWQPLVRAQPEHGAA